MLSESFSRLIIPWLQVRILLGPLNEAPEIRLSCACFQGFSHSALSAGTHKGFHWILILGLNENQCGPSLRPLLPAFA